MFASLIVLFASAAPAAASEFPEALTPDHLNLPRGYVMAAYLDCGSEAEGKEAAPQQIHMTSGTAHVFPQVEGPLGRAACDPERVAFEVAGLEAEGEYLLVLTWWDADESGRVQSIAMGGMEEPLTEVLSPTPAKSFHKDQPTWARILLPVPSEYAAAGGLRLEVRPQSGPNAVVNELCLLKRTAPAKEKRVLVVTGDDYPGHVWRETGPVLAEALREDARLEVSICEAPAILGSALLKHYDAVLIHFKNYSERLPLGEPVWRGLAAYMEQGGGLLIAHFGCGAFQEWDGFVQWAGRVWNPAMRAHDPYGPFEVRIADATHPITSGMETFPTQDELYTCLDGTPAIHVICDAVSKVDKEPHPMAFVVDGVPGGAFHCTLGHDVPALEAEGTRALYRRAAAWAAGLAPK